MIADFVHSDGASVDADNAFLLKVNYQAVLKYRIVPRYSQDLYSFHDDNAGKSREHSSSQALVGIGYGT